MKTVTSETELTMTLSDGRRLGYAQFGDISGQPVLYNPSGTRLDLQAFSPLAATLGVRLIALDRPGIGLSDFRPDYEILDWPDDVAEAAAQLGLERFAMLATLLARSSLWLAPTRCRVN
jgi:pimeloyl-ACP methyl ester carboxylesterase